MACTDEGEGICLLLLHGFPLSRGAWSQQVEAFKGRYRVVAPDLPGFGDSPVAPGPFPIRRYAEEVHALVQQLDTGPVVLVGHSMGGYVALALAHAHPGSVQALVLVGTKAGPDTPEAAEARRALADQVGVEGTREVIRTMAAKMLSGANRDAAMAAAVRGFMAPSTPEGVMEALRGMAERPDARPWLAEFQMPVLAIAGLDDTLIPPSESQSMAKAIRGADVKLIPRAGHLVAFDRAEVFNTALRDWLEQQRGLRRAG